MHKQPFDHDRDFYAWAIQSASDLRAGRVTEVDLARVAEELEDMGKAQRHALASHLKVLIVHLLEGRFQRDHRGVSGQLSIDNARDEIAELLEDSPSLRSVLDELMTRRYPVARRRAALETGLAIATFPEEPPFTVEQLLDPDFLD
jgi:hypothetical protein